MTDASLQRKKTAKLVLACLHVKATHLNMDLIVLSQFTNHNPIILTMGKFSFSEGMFPRFLYFIYYDFFLEKITTFKLICDISLDK